MCYVSLFTILIYIEFTWNRWLPQRLRVLRTKQAGPGKPCPPKQSAPGQGLTLYIAVYLINILPLQLRSGDTAVATMVEFPGKDISELSSSRNIRSRYRQQTAPVKLIPLTNDILRVFLFFNRFEKQKNKNNNNNKTCHVS